MLNIEEGKSTHRKQDKIIVPSKIKSLKTCLIASNKTIPKNQ
jgi:hypothetical protein